MRSVLFLLAIAGACLLPPGCGGDEPRYDEAWQRTVSQVRVDETVLASPSGELTAHTRPHIRDAYGRYVHFHGINVSGSTKFPPTEVFDPEKHVLEIGDSVSYVGKPFALDAADDYTGKEQSADDHFRRLQKLGFNSIRLLINWEGVQHAGPWTFDKEYLDYLAAIVDKAKEHGIYVLLDIHQDMWSRHLFVRYNKDPVDKNGKPYARGSLEAALMALIPPYNNWVRGDGAPRWVVEACLPEKAPYMDGPNWGTPQLLGGLGPNQMLALLDVFQMFYPQGEGEIQVPEWLETLLANLPEPFDINETSDFLPWTMWGINGTVGLDAQRCFATFFAGDKLYPKYQIEGMGVGDYLQENYEQTWVEIAKRMKDKTNVIGYDIMNEPLGFYLTMAVIAVYFQTGAADAAQTFLEGALGKELGKNLFTILTGLGILPADANPETIEKWGFKDADLGAMIGLNYGFDANHLQPMYERMGKAIQAVDEDAVIWFEGGMGMESVLGGGLSQWQVNMTRPKGVNQAVFAPHWYPDIYPFIGINQPPRTFANTEWKYRSFVNNLKAFDEKTRFSLGNVPIVFGEFGTYFNYNGIDASLANDYLISSQILDAYYRSFEELGLSQMVWCYSPENTYEYGDGWDLEDFSVVDPDLNPRGHLAYVRPYARATSGRQLRAYFNGPLGYLEQDKGVPVPVGEYRLEMASKESDAPTEIFVPRIQYPKGFYVKISDGFCYYDDAHQLLFWYPSVDRPEAVHTLTLQGPREGVDDTDWDYLFSGNRVLDKSEGIE